MTRSVKRVVLVLLAAAVLAFAAWMLWPRSLGGAFAFDQPFTLTVTELEMQEDGSWTVKEPVSSVLEPGTPAAETVREALEGNPYVAEVAEVAVDFEGGLLRVAATINTIYGEVDIGV